MTMAHLKELRKGTKLRLITSYLDEYAKMPTKGIIVIHQGDDGTSDGIPVHAKEFEKDGEDGIWWVGPTHVEELPNEVA